MLTDKQLVDQARHGDRQSYGELVKRHQDRVFRYVLHYLPSWQDAEDVAQDAFIEAFRSIRKFRGDSAFGTWVVSIARIRVANWYRHRRSEDMVSQVPDGEQSGEEPSMVLRMDVRGAVARLPEPYREAVVLRYFCGLDTKDISLAIGDSRNVVSVRLHRARAMLRDMLGFVQRGEECGNAM